MSDETNPTLSRKDALDHAWGWFTVHAAQRLQSFNFFLIATAFLVAAYATVLEKHSGVTAIAATFGAWITFWFYRMERRTRQLVNAAEDALDPMQKDLADISDNAQMRILKKVKAAEKGASTYGKVIWIIQWTTLGVFALLALYAALRYCNQSELLL